MKLKLHFSREDCIISVSRDNATPISREQLGASSCQVLGAAVGRNTAKEQGRFLYIHLLLFLTGSYFFRTLGE